MESSLRDQETPVRIGVLICLFACLTSLAIATQSWWSIEQDRQLTLNSEYEHGLVAVRLLDEHATQTIREGERNLDAVINAIHIAGKDKVISNQLIRTILTRAQPFNRAMKALQFVSPEGEAWVSSIDYPAYQTDADDRTYIPQLLNQREEAKVVIGKPFQRFYDGELVLPIAKNVFAEDGKYLGIISTDISISYFSSVYQRVAKDSAAMVSLFTLDGTIIVRFPLLPEQVGQKLSNSSTFQSLRQRSTEGMFEDAHFLDEAHTVPRLYTFRKAADLPIVAIFARDTENILSDWRKRSKNRVIFSSLIITLLVSISYFLWRQFTALHRAGTHLRRSELAAKTSEVKFTQLFEHSPIPLALLQLPTLRVLELNHKMLDLLKLDANNSKDAYLRDLIKLRNGSEIDEQLGSILLQQQTQNQEVELLDRDNRISVCQISSCSIKVNQQDLVILSMVDISLLRQVESEIRRLNNDLEEKVRVRTQGLEAANADLASALGRLKDMQEEILRSEKMAALGYLVAGISHELNTPIGNSLMVASTVHDCANELLAVVEQGQVKKSKLIETLLQSARASEILLRNLERAAHLIHSFKQVAVDQSSDQYRSFELNNTIAEILTTLEPLYRKTPYSVEVSSPIEIQITSYPGALAQIITNIITNALAHGLEGRTHGRILIETMLENEDWVGLKVSDDGNGISEENLPRVFDPFFTTKLGQGGSGLGLNIVYNLVTDVLQGRINIVSKLGQGTSVMIHFPRTIKEHKEA